jgi:hypothetical protein
VSEDSPGGRELLRHTLATLAYRGGKAVRQAGPDFGSFRLGEGTREPLRILAHINDLLDWMLHLCQGRHVWNDSVPESWQAEVDRFHRSLARVDTFLASPEPLGFPVERLFQGPVADALSHVGQLTLLRRRAGQPVRGENYFKADIVAGRLGPDQATARVEFD